MQLRLATDSDEDILEIDTIVREYNQEENKAYGYIIDRDKVKRSIIEGFRGRGIFGVVDGKVIGGITYVVMENFFTNDVMCVVMFFYVKPEFRRYSINFMRAFEKECATMTSANMVVFASPAFAHASKYHRFYCMMGYKEMERHYQKAVSRGN